YGSPIPPFDKPDPNYTTIAAVTTVSPTSLPNSLPTLTTVGSVTTTTVASTSSSSTSP
ncbi:MAG: NlpC/P60 family protein, partial [Actinobacteria bacterium]|nr:NlpC/P60 family protein [Actinomycetota bacterium]